MRILLIEDDTVLGAAVRDQIAAGGQSVDWVTRLDAAGDAMAGTGYDLVLLDLMLPDGRGITFLRSLRTSGDVTPVIILTALDQISDRIEGLNAGADDYLVKPDGKNQPYSLTLMEASNSAASEGTGTAWGCSFLVLDQSMIFSLASH